MQKGNEILQSKNVAEQLGPIALAVIKSQECFMLLLSLC